AQEELNFFLFKPGSQEARLAGIACVFDMERSGARLAWEYFFPEKDPPWLVNYVQDRDLWRWKLPHSREVSAFIASCSHDFQLWDFWVKESGQAPPEQFVGEGRAILRYQSQQVDAICKNAAEMEMDGHKVLAVNTSVLFSEVAGKLAEG